MRTKQENVAEPENTNLPESVSIESVVEPESTIDSPPTETEEIFVDSIDATDPPAEALSLKTSDTLSTSSINDVIEIALQEMDMLDEKVSLIYEFLTVNVAYESTRGPDYFSACFAVL